MSQKIDAAEGYVMSDLEGMEARRLDQASKISAEFEDRWVQSLSPEWWFVILTDDILNIYQRIKCILFPLLWDWWDNVVMIHSTTSDKEIFL